ncbi:MFS transporter [Actinokineospora spheciospongiae]|uniref:MFS transporter n=1 Tax=Actinokineospora spheciospongiae TaxID=909613 RepID=UPI000D71C703|nr:MFS transporter [Actinokineospora spheciospongiae]PWW55420.1 putative MFS family arabinose efflux permease [Actinokineospora spheciospongiae]
MTPPPPRSRTGLLVLAAASFVTILTEALPAGVLPALSADLAIGESRAGLFVTGYALAAAVTAIPLTALTLRVPRRALLVALLVAFAATNLVTAVSGSFPLSLAARVLSGVAAGVLWALVPGYAARLDPQRSGRAIATALAGMTIGLSLGIPAGTALADLVGWRVTFGLLSGMAAVLAVVGLRVLPPVAAPPPTRGAGMAAVLRTPGVAAVNGASVAVVLGFYVLYTYIAPFVAGRGVAAGTVLFVFGLGSLAGVWAAGATADRAPRLTTLTVLGLCALCLAGFGVVASSAPALLGCAALWGLTHGAVPVLMQTAGVRAAPHAADTANSIWVTGWNIGMAGGSLLGGAVLDTAGVAATPWVAAGLATVGVVVVALARRTGFPPARSVRAGQERLVEQQHRERAEPTGSDTGL